MGDKNSQDCKIWVIFKNWKWDRDWDNMILYFYSGFWLPQFGFIPSSINWLIDLWAKSHPICETSGTLIVSYDIYSWLNTLQLQAITNFHIFDVSIPIIIVNIVVHRNSVFRRYRMLKYQFIICLFCNRSFVLVPQCKFNRKELRKKAVRIRLFSY